MINEVFRTIIVIAVAVTSVFVIGFCLLSLVERRLHFSCTSEQLWAAAPLVGAGAIILVCQNLLYLNIRIFYSAILIWICIGFIAIFSGFKFRFVFAEIPWKLIGTGLLIYAVHASGLLVSGVSNYYGYGWLDMYNYVSQAQFFMDFPFNSAVNTHEYLRTAHFYMHDRIGQSVLHAFIASSSGADAQQTFGATILLSPMLIFFSIFLLSTSLSIERRFAYPAAILASLSPAIASVHLECFFSQAMAIPFVFLWPMAVSRLKSHPGVYSILLVGFLFAVTSAIYTEVIPPLILISVFVLAVSHWYSYYKNVSVPQIVQLSRSWKQLLVLLISLCLAIAFGFLANIGYLKGAFLVMVRTTGASVLDILYPWAFKLEGLVRLWLGHQSPLPSNWLFYFIVFISAIVALAAVAYAVFLWKKDMSPILLFFIMILCIPFAPLLLSVLTKNKYPYQFFKLLLIVWPLILFLGTCGIAKLISKIKKGRGYDFFFLIVLICANFILIYRITFAATKPETVARSSRGGAHLLIDNNFKQIRTLLDQLQGKQIYIWWYDKALWNGNWRGRWLDYYAKKNKVWSMNPISSSGSGVLPAFESLPVNTIKLPAIGISWIDVSVGTPKKIGSSLAGTDCFWFYQFTDTNEIRYLDQVSRAECGIVSRTMRLSVDKNPASDTWYPLWAVGQEGSATLITANFAKSGVRFRYDQWGYPPTIIEPCGKCSGSEFQVSVRIDQSKRKVIINCNGAVAEGDIADVLTYLSCDAPLGVNNVSKTLEGKYPLAKVFPGKIVDVGNDRLIQNSVKQILLEKHTLP